MKHLTKFEDYLEEKNKGLWANVAAKKKRGEKPAKKGDENYPDEKAYKSATEKNEVDEAMVQVNMKYIKLFEEFINEDKIQNALDNIDKWMPEDSELQDEYYQLIRAKDEKGMEKFLDMYADEDRLMKYGIKFQDLGKLVKLILKESVNEAKSEGKASIESLSIGNTYKDSKGYLVKVVDISGTGNSWKITIKDEHGTEKTIKTSLDKGVNLYKYK